MAKSKAMFQFVENKNGNCRLCKEADTKDNMVSCDDCDRWFHLSCVHLKHTPSQEERFLCAKCEYLEIERATLLDVKVKFDLANQLNESLKIQQDVANRRQSEGSLNATRQALIKLPKFSGEAREWPKFKSIFKDTSAEGRFTNLENLSRLEEALYGQAAKSVSNLMIGAANVPRIMQRLEEIYGRPEAIYQQLLNELIKTLNQPKLHTIDIANALDDLVVTMETLAKPEFLHDYRLITDIVSKLPFSMQITWTEALQRNVSQPTLHDLNKWLQTHATTLRRLAPPTRKEQKPRINIHNNPSKMQCNICKHEHQTFKCNILKNLNVEQRQQRIQQLKLCFSCLNKGHGSKFCRSKRECKIDGCKGMHNRLLHKAAVEKPKENQNLEKDKTNNNHHGSRKSTVYYQIVPVTLQNGNLSLETFAFLDPGSSLSLLDQSVADKLGLHGRSEPLELTWTQNVSKESPSRRVQLWIRGHGGKTYSMKDVRTIEDIELPTQTLDIKHMKKEFTYLADVPVQGYVNAKPTILIGMEHAHLLLTTDRRISDENSPMAARTKLGWLIFGKVYRGEPSYSFCIREHESTDLRAIFENYCSTENFGVNVVNKLPKSAEVERAESIIKNTIKYENGHYSIGLLWKTESMSFPPSFNNAFKRLEILEKTLARKPELRKWAIESFEGFVKKGYARKLSPRELLQEHPNTYYLPHFIVTNKNKVPPKSRIVFDAAAAVEGVSFNSALLSGPDTVKSLFGVLLRFREFKIAVTGDIQEMFQQIKIVMEDQPAQRYLWRQCEADRDPSVYVMESMIFGSTCSPACAQAVKNYNAQLFKDDFPKASEASENNFYVDDYLDSFDEIKEASEVVQGVINIQQYAGFHLRNFITNSQQLANVIPSERLHVSEIKWFENKEIPTDKVLGIYWNTTTDLIEFQLKLDRLEFTRLITKRETLSFVMSIYDPLGLISNFTIHGRILLQKWHKESSDWDSQLPDSLSNFWNSWIDMLKLVTHFKIPRCMTLKNALFYELHMFGDASENAFAAVVYLRSVTANGTDVNIVSAKARVSPNKMLSIPRLELQAAILGIRLLNTVKKELRISISKCVMWSDSQTVLAWINSQHRRYKQFVAHRVAEILETTSMDQWRYIKSSLNPADEGTKIKKGASLWLNGPSFLRKSESYWPNWTVSMETDEELRNYVNIHQRIHPYSFIQDDYFSDWWRLVKRTLIIKKFTDWIKNKTDFDRSTNYDDVKWVENAIFKKAQWDCFAEEVTLLKEGKEIEKSSNLRKLSPMLDNHGVLRARGRLEHARSIPESARKPIILPYEHNISFLIVKTYHERYLHQNDNVVIAAILQKFWIIKQRSLLKKVKKYCQECIIANAKPVPPMMAPLPDYRTESFLYPFTHTGVDYFGPFEVAVKRSREKRWGVIFTCMSSRAVHIEMAEKLDTDSFIVCLRNFQNRRGKIKHLYSDNGTNFVGADNELKELIVNIDKRMRNGDAAALALKWTFNPPAASHFGGVWERLIKIIKLSLYKMLKQYGSRLPRPAILRSALIQVEFILNSRPLTHIPVEDIDDEIMTPFHILIGRAGEYVPPYDPTAIHLEKHHWKKVQNYGKYFWDRWTKEYLPLLLKRNKWTNQIEPIKVDDIVVITDDKAPPGTWLKGRVISVRMAKDGQVRSAEIKTSKGIYERPAVKVAVLDVRKIQKPKPSLETNDDLFQQTQNFQGSHDTIPLSEPKKLDSPDLIPNQDDHEEMCNLRSNKTIRTKNPSNFISFMLLVYMFTLIFGFETRGLIAFDCANPEVNMTSYSLLDVASCIPQKSNLSSTEITIQVLQRNVKSLTKVLQCKVIIRRSIRHCGAFSHTSDYQYGYSYIVKEFNSEECTKVHALGIVSLTHDRQINELKLNSTTRGETLIVGSVTGNSCNGGTYSTPFYTWTGALVYYEYEIALYDYIANIDLENDQIYLKNGLMCSYSIGTCLDSEEGYLTWNVDLNQSCETTEFEVIYEGLVNKTTSLEGNIKQTHSVVYSTISEKQVFSIKTREDTRICGYNGFTTDHPRILIIETESIRSPFTRKANSGKNLDLFTYFNSKITLVESYIGQSLNDIYNMVMAEMCKLDKVLLETKLTLARLNPNEFVSSIMKRNGYTAVVAGEVLHVLECKPVYITPRFTEQCYQEIPVFYNNVSMFLAPVTRVLQTLGTEIECTPLLPAKFKFGSRWYTTDGRLRETTAPSKLSTDIVTSWSYTPLPNLMESGVYDSNSLVKMRNMIYEQGERRVASSVVYKILAGQNPNTQGFRFDALLSEKIIDGAIHKYWNKVLSWSTWLGNTTSTFIGIYLFARGLKFIVDTIIHSQILYDIYGFSWKLIASFWDSLTNFLSHKNIRRETVNKMENNRCSEENQQPNNETEETEMNLYRGNVYPKFNTNV